MEGKIRIFEENLTNEREENKILSEKNIKQLN